MNFLKKVLALLTAGAIVPPLTDEFAERQWSLT
jgi:hypothetical protein